MNNFTMEDFSNNEKPFVIYKQDCLAFMKTLPDESVDLIATDPPYRVTSRGSSKNVGGMLKKEIFNKGKVFSHNSIDPKDYLPEFFRILKDGSHCYVMTNNVNLQEILNTATECGFKFIKSLIWNKGNKIMSQFYMSQFEYILFLRKGRGIKINNCGTSDLISIPNKKTKDEEGNNIHDTEKPVALMELLILNSSKENDIVYEPFLGSGSTGVAAIRSNRRFLGTELDDRYFDTSTKRINEEYSIKTGKPLETKTATFKFGTS